MSLFDSNSLAVQSKKMPFSSGKLPHEIYSVSALEIFRTLTDDAMKKSGFDWTTVSANGPNISVKAKKSISGMVDAKKGPEVFESRYRLSPEQWVRDYAKDNPKSYVNAVRTLMAAKKKGNNLDPDISMPSEADDHRRFTEATRALEQWAARAPSGRGR